MNFTTSLFTDKIEHEPADVFIRRLKRRQNDYDAMNIIGTDTICEFLLEGAATKIYFDVDIKQEIYMKFPALGIYESVFDKRGKPSQFILNDIRDAILASLPVDSGIDITSMSYTPGTKFSVHVVCFGKAHRHVIKNIAIKANEHIIGKYKVPMFDLQVYGKTQKFRTAFSSKYKERRIKIPIYGTIEDSLVTYDLENCIDCPPLLYAPMEPQLPDQPRIEYPAQIIWFEQVLKEKELSLLWKAMACQYDDWATVGRILYVTCKDIDVDRGLYLFIEFSKFGDNFVEADVKRKYTTAFKNSSNASFASVLKRVKTFNNAIAKLYQPVYDGRVKTAQASKMVTLPSYTYVDNGDGTLDSDYFAYTKFEFMIYYQCCYSKFISAFWKHALNCGDGIKIILSILKNNDPALEDYDSKIEACQATFGDSFGESLHPFEHRPKYTLQFVKFMHDEFNIPFDQDKFDVANETQWTKENLAVQASEYREKSLILDPKVVKNCDEWLATQIKPLAPQEYRSISDILLDIANNDYLWVSQYPYHNTVQHLRREEEGEWKNVLLAFRLCMNAFVAEKKFHFLSSAYCERAAAKIIFAAFPFWIIAEDQETVLVFDIHSGIWTGKQSVKQALIADYSNLLQDRHAQPSKSKNFGDTVASTAAVTKSVEQIPAIKIDGYTRCMELISTSREKLLFKNGVYDGVSDTFFPKPSTDFFGETCSYFKHTDIMFLGKINDEYLIELEDGDAEDVDDLNNKIFYDIRGADIGEYWKENLIIALMGIISKKAYLHLGDPNSGKSTELSMVKESFGSYVGSCNLGVFAFHKFEQREIGRVHGAFAALWFHRLILFSEKFNGVLDNEMFKSHTSGGKDTIMGRRLHVDEVYFVPKYMFAIYANSQLKWAEPDEDAIVQRLDTFTLNKIYVEHPTDPFLHLQANNVVDNWSKDLKKRQLFVRLMLVCFQNYKRRGHRLTKPDSLQQEQETGKKSEYTTIETIALFQKYFLFTGNAKDYVKVQDLKTIAEENGLIYSKVNNTQIGRAHV